MKTKRKYDCRRIKTKISARRESETSAQEKGTKDMSEQARRLLV